MGILYRMSPLYCFLSLILLGYYSNQVLAGMYGVSRKCMTVPYPTNCHFPFTYKDKTYNNCTKEDNWGVPWCSTDPNGDGDSYNSTWANCEVSKECVFPTTYEVFSLTCAPSLTTMDIPGAIQRMVDGETVTGVHHVKWNIRILNIGKRTSQTHQATQTLKEFYLTHTTETL